MGPVDLARLARAVALDVVRLEDGDWLVSGGAQPHHVSADGRSCDCWDHAVHEGIICKHRTRILLARGDAAAWAGLRALVAQPRRRRRTVAP